ncbi:MAG: hypothetical protein ACI9YO_002946 [Gammaproteobacteria bacterium]|jgi:hypothetical protein
MIVCRRIVKNDSKAEPIMLRRLYLIILLIVFYATALMADVLIEFREGAPKDRFIMTNVGDCGFDALRITVDLSSSASGVIFDTTSNGAGVEVFQPFEVVKGAELLSSNVKVLDGDQVVSLNLNHLDKSQKFAFTIDVDDTEGNREITVSGSELSGAVVTMETNNGTYSATFDEYSRAVIKVEDCAS